MLLLGLFFPSFYILPGCVNVLTIIIGEENVFVPSARCNFSMCHCLVACNWLMFMCNYIDAPKRVMKVLQFQWLSSSTDRFEWDSVIISFGFQWNSSSPVSQRQKKTKNKFNKFAIHQSSSLFYFCDMIEVLFSEDEHWAASFFVSFSICFVWWIFWW